MPEEKKYLSDLEAYVYEQRNMSFSEKAFNTADGLVLAELAYIDWSGLNIDDSGNGKLLLKDAIDLLEPDYKSGLSETRRELLTKIASGDNNRFGNMEISNFFQSNIKKHEVSSLEELEQFGAVTFTYTDGEGNRQNYCAFRGTDNTLEGWAEDFNMGYDNMTEAQNLSVQYLNKVSKKTEGEISLGGHSKGGNDAAFAFLFCDGSVRKRIEKIYSYDGPGMPENISYVDEHGNVTPLDPEIEELMEKKMEGSAICPYDSIVGQLLKENKSVFIDTKAGMGADHDPYTWKIDSNTGEFVPREQDWRSKYLNEVTDEWIRALPVEKRKVFMQVIWGWIYSLDKERMSEIGPHIAENPQAAIESALSYINSLPENEKKSFIGGMAFLAVLLVGNFLEYKIPGIETMKTKISYELSERNIHTMGEFWAYLMKDPIRNTFDFMQSLLSDREFLKALAEAALTVAVLKALMKIITFILASALTFIISNLPVIAEIVAAIVVCALAVKFIKEHWEEFVNCLNEIYEFIQEKISEFVEAMKLAIVAGANALITSVVYIAEEIAEEFVHIKDVLIDIFQKIGQYASRSLQLCLKLSNPILYTIIRAIIGYVQPPVTIDMSRLQAAVDQMDRLASRVAGIDQRLNSLYGRMCISNIQQGEGIFVSLANMYHLSRADINVDEGYKIRRKANAIKELFGGYKDAERWALGQIGG